ncbi:MAG: transpeptidase family protein [Acidobacteriia bacterium]|nr:transpeptidase family protein [Terriglobia bacterium]
MQPSEHSAEIVRLRRLARFALIWALVILARLVYLQVYRHQDLKQQAESQQQRELEVQAPRGDILDANGEKLVVSTPVDSIAINPRLLKDPAVATELLSRVLYLNKAELSERIRQAQRTNRAFLWVKRKLTQRESEQLRSFRAEWMEFRQESKRVYLNGALAANLLGSVDSLENGNAGIELSLQKELQGKAGYVRVLTDVRQRGIDTQVEAQPQPGKTVALTIDQRLQYYSDLWLRGAVEQWKGEGGSIVVMDPKTGRILAMSSFPTFDPNAPPASIDPEHRRNRTVENVHEPGSVGKVFTLAAAMETTSLNKDSSIFCHNGRMSWYGNFVSDTHRYGWLTVQEVLEHSSNIGALNIGRQAGAANLYHYLHDVFGFGYSTGTGLAGESWGRLRPVSKWSAGTVGYASFGHEFNVTTMQLARALSVIANGGALVTPQIVLWQQREDGKREYTKVVPPRPVLKPETAMLMRSMMEGVMLRGTGKKGRLEENGSGGKTGTARIFDLKTNKYIRKYHSTFMGLAPLTDPKVVVVVTLNGIDKMAGDACAPIYKKVASMALRLQGVTRDLPEVEPAVTPLRLASSKAAQDGAARHEPGACAPQGFSGAASALCAPKKDAPLTATAVDATQLNPEEIVIASGDVIAPRMPDFKGKSVRVVIKEALALGMDVDMVGSGLAREQDPPAGTMLTAGRRARVQFAR